MGKDGFPHSVRRILVPVDGSTHSDKAVDLAADLAKKYDAKLDLIYVISDFAEYERFGEAYEGKVSSSHLTEVASERIDAQCEKFLDAAGERASTLGVTDVGKVCRNGDPADEILNFADDNHIDLIVMGGRGLGRFSRAFMGSVSNKVAHHAKCTVVIVR
jgi:nucleotide-binding universal stress UspA family protein